MIIDFLLLACSYKHGGRCVAGIDLTNKKLVRLVTDEDDETGAIPTSECRCGGRMLQQMTVYEINVFREGIRSGAQKENYIVRSGFVIKEVRKASFDEMKDYFTYHVPPFNSSAPFLTRDEYYSYAYGKGSLMLYNAYAVKGTIANNSENKAKEKVSFDLYINKEKRTFTDYSCTASGDEYYNRQFSVGKAVILISLPPEARNDMECGRYYKFVSAIIPNNTSKSTTYKNTSNTNLEDLFPF